MARMRRLRAKIAPADSHEGTAAAGAHVYQGWGKFVGPHEIEVNGRLLRFKKCVIATGGKPRVPEVPGLAGTPYITNNTLFNLTTLPPRLTILGSGVVGLEMAQAFSIFGSKVTVLVRGKRLLPREDIDVAATIQAALEADGVRFLFEAALSEVSSHLRRQLRARQLLPARESGRRRLVGRVQRIACGDRPRPRYAMRIGGGGRRGYCRWDCHQRLVGDHESGYLCYRRLRGGRAAIDACVGRDGQDGSAECSFRR